MLRRSLTWQAVRHRRGQAVVLMVLSVLITTATVVGPLYSHAVNEAVVRSTLDNASVSSTGLSVHYDPDNGPVGPDELLPAASRKFYGPELQGEQASVGIQFSSTDSVPATLATREGICTHLRFVAGTCPSGEGQLAVSEETAKADGLRVGGTLLVIPDPEGPGQKLAAKMTIAAIYARFDPASPYWFDHPYVGPVTATHQQPDALLTGYGFLDPTVKLIIKANLGADISVDQFVDVPLKARSVGVAQTTTALAGIDHARAIASQHQTVLNTALDSLLTSTQRQRTQVSDVVPLFAGELVLLAVALLLFVVSAAATQRRPEVALARLRGQRPLAAAGLLVGELALPVLIGVPLGALLAGAALQLARAVWLPPGVPFIVGWPVLAALAAALLLQLLVIALVARRLVREPVNTLLRRIPVRGARVRFGVVEVGVAALAVAGVLTVVSSGLSGPIAVLAPGLLALAVGLLAGGAVPVLAARVGPRALARGRVRVGLGALQMARRPGTRGVFVLLVVAVASLVAVTDVWRVAAANRQIRAGIETGAPAVMQVRAPSIRALSAATTRLDPTGKRIVPTATIEPPNVGVSVLAIRPAGTDVVQWGWDRDRPTAKDIAALSPSLPATITLTGSSVEVHLADVVVKGGPPPNLFLDLVGADGVPGSYDLGRLPAKAATIVLRRPLTCADGCRLAGLTLFSSLLDSTPKIASIGITGITMHAGDDPTAADGTPVDLGTATDWRGSSAAVATTDDMDTLEAAIDGGLPPADPPSYPLADVNIRPGGPGLTLHAYSDGDKVGLVHGDVPLRIPALTAALPDIPGESPASFTAGRLDGLTQAFQSVGRVGSVPSLHGAAAVVDLDLLTRLSDQADPASSYAVWLADGSSGNVARQRAALAADKIVVASVSRVADRREQLDKSGAVWSLRLGLLAGLAGVLVAMAVLAIGVITTLRSRRYDVAALRLSGVSRRDTSGAAVGEQVAMSVAGSLVGAACGVVGARLLFRAAPFLAGGDGFGDSRIYTTWVLAVATWLAGLALLVVVAVLGARVVARGAVPAVVRDGTT